MYYRINLPTHIMVGNKRISLNLNHYRNAHFHVLNKAKALFQEQISLEIKHLKRMQKVDITYILYLKTKQESDISNVCSIVDKFFCDTLVHAGKLSDDNYKIIPNIKYEFGGIDSNNPRVEAVLSNIEFESEPKKEPNQMKIILTQEDIEAALNNYVAELIPFGADTKINVNLNTDDAEAIVTITKVSTVEAGNSVNEEIKKAPVETQKPKEEHPVPEGLFVPQTPNPTTQAPASAPTGVEAPKSLFGNLAKPS